MSLMHSAISRRPHLPAHSRQTPIISPACDQAGLSLLPSESPTSLANASIRPSPPRLVALFSTYPVLPVSRLDIAHAWSMFLLSPNNGIAIYFLIRLPRLDGFGLQGHVFRSLAVVFLLYLSFFFFFGFGVRNRMYIPHGLQHTCAPQFSITRPSIATKTSSLLLRSSLSLKQILPLHLSLLLSRTFA